MSKSFDPTKLLPGNYSTAGFIAPGENYQELIQKDAETLKSLGITHDQIADRLEYIMGRARRLCNDVYDESLERIDIFDVIKQGFLVGGVNVSWTSWMGWQDCPWDCSPKGDRFAHSDTDFHLGNKAGSFSVSELLVHLVRVHKFFEGHTKYRLDPAQCVAVLGLVPGVCYKPTYDTMTAWSVTYQCSRGGDGHTYDKYVEEIRRYNYLEDDVLIDGLVKEVGKGITIRHRDDKMAIVSLRNKVVYGNFEVGDVPLRSIDPGASIYEKRSYPYVVQNEGEVEQKPIVKKGKHATSDA